MKNIHEDVKELKRLVDHWGKRLEDIGPQLRNLRDDPESFTREEVEALLKETEKVFKAWDAIRFVFNLQLPTKTVQ